MTHEPDIREHVHLAPLTTIGLGGNARWYTDVATVDELRAALEWAASRNLRRHVLGGGSNTIFPDEDFPGLVIRITFRGMTEHEAGEHVTLTAGAGEDWDRFVQHCVAKGYGGIECLSGIPGLVGATPIQNVGAYGQEVSDTIVSVHALSIDTLETVMFEGSECRFSYRQSRFKQEDREKYVVTGVTFRLSRNGRPAIRYGELKTYLNTAVPLGSLADGTEALNAVRNAVLTLRRHKSMVIDPEDPNTRSVGSFFVNPVIPMAQFQEAVALWRTHGGSGEIPSFPSGSAVKVPAGWLIEHAGFPKGYRKGNVGVSSNHALALINAGGTTKELLALAGMVAAAVQQRFGIALEREPVVVG